MAFNPITAFSMGFTCANNATKYPDFSRVNALLAHHSIGFLRTPFSPRLDSLSS
jgi:hypothetical protein